MFNYFNEKDKYYINSQRYSECQLVSAINAAIYLNEVPVLQHSIEYERLVDLASTRHGGAIHIDLAHKYLRIIPKEIDVTLENIKKYLNTSITNSGNPIEIGIYHKKYGTHSVLIIDYSDSYVHKQSKSTKMVRVLNLEFTNNRWWIPWRKFRTYLPDKSLNIIPKCQVFKLDPWYLRDLQICNNQRLLSGGNGVKNAD